MTYVAVGPYCWGSGKTAAVAVKKAKKMRAFGTKEAMPYNLYEASDDFEVFSDNRIEAKKLTKLKEHRPAT